MPPVEEYEGVLIEWEVASALVVEASWLAWRVIQEDGGLLPPPEEGGGTGGVGGPPAPGGNVGVLAAPPTGPLNEAEVNRLLALARSPTLSAPMKAERAALATRMRQSGVKFEGTDAIDALEKVLNAAQGLPVDPRKYFLQGYRDALGLAKNGLTKIDEERYSQYKSWRNSGYSHDSSWTWMYGGDTALRRYRIEKLLERAN
ncbi:MAG: hypothetical protein ACRC33_18930 [Gemmataceae bacterium]